MPTRLRPPGVAAWVLLSGTVVSVDPAGLLPATTLRWAVASTAVLVLAACCRRRPSLPPGVALAALGLVVLVAASAVTGIDPVRAWLGHPRRNLGVLTWVVLLASGLLGASAGADDPRSAVRRSIGRAAAAGAVLVGATTAAELLGAAPGGLGFAGDRAGGWYAQPVTLAAAALLLAFTAAGTAMDAGQPRGWRLAGVAGSGGCVLALAASQTRGAWVGAATGVVVLAPTLRRRAGASPRVVAVAVAAVAVVGLVVAVSPLGARAASAFDDGGTGRGRLDEWRVAAEVVTDRPLLGVGPEGYRIVAPGAIDASYADRYGRDVVVDRAHNGPLDVAVASGIPAAALYAAVLAAVVRAAWRTNRRSPGSVAALAGAGVTAFVVAQLSAFPSAEVDPMAWFLGGFVLASDRATASSWPDATHRRTGAVASLVRVVCLAAGLVMVWAGPTSVAVDRLLAAAVHEAADGDRAAALERADRATDLRPDHPDAWYVAAKIAGDGPSLLDLDAAIDRAEAGRSRVPGDPGIEQLRAELLAARALRSGLPGDRTTATAALQDRLDRDPTHPVLRDLLAELSSGGDGTAAG